MCPTSPSYSGSAAPSRSRRTIGAADVQAEVEHLAAPSGVSRMLAGLRYPGGSRFIGNNRTDELR